MTSDFDRLKTEKYVLFTTFRKDGTPVPTPVWAAPDGERLVVWSERKAGKVKRIRRDGAAKIQACDLRGKQTHGPELDVTARLLGDDELERVRKALARKYGLIGQVTMLFSRLRGPKDRTIGIAIEPARP
jgi:PPOX class probable F420-dependent enzyme